MKKFIYLTGLLIALGLLFFHFPKNTPVTPSPQPTINSVISSPTATSSAQVLGVRTKISGCVISNGLPDKECTPGAMISGVTKDQVCTPGYATSVRNVPESERNQVYAEYGITSRESGEYEVDHLISLELGGSNDISNLWPEAAEPRPGFHEKDKVENYLHSQLCNGEITLDQAQQQISTNWLEVYQKISQ